MVKNLKKFHSGNSGLTADSATLRGAKALEFGAVLDEKDLDEREANQLHARYSASLSKKGPFTHVRRNVIDRTFSTYCERSEMDETKLPLVVVGGQGSGKSAALSTWADRRASAALMQNQQLREFVFLHHVGASRDSVELFHMLRRLIHAIQERFNLPISLQNTEEGLCRELPRLLQSAASRCSGVVIIVDGIDKVMTIDGSRAGLKWLPFILPPKTRFILSITEKGTGWKRYIRWYNSVHDNTGFSSEGNDSNVAEFSEAGVPKPSIVITEIARRGWDTYEVPLLKTEESRKILDRFLDTPRSVHGHGKIHVHASFALYQEELASNKTFLTGLDFDENISMHLRLFNVHVDLILGHPLAQYPQFLSSLLVSLAFFSDHGYCLNYCLQKLLKCKTFRELFSCQLGLWEDGFRPTAQITAAARTIANKSQLYVPNPKCQHEEEYDGDALGEKVAHMFVKPEEQMLHRQHSHTRPKSRVETLRAQSASSTISSQGYSDDDFETSGNYSTDGFEEESGESSQKEKAFGGMTHGGRTRTYSTNVDVKSGSGYNDFSDSLVKEHAAVTLQAAFRGFKSRSDIFNAQRGESPPHTESRRKLMPRSKRPTRADPVPQYLLGGSPVKGVADWIGQALCLSFVSRIGLSIAELFDILEYIARDDLDEFFAAKAAAGESSSIVRTPRLHEDNALVSQETKLALLRALDSIGAVSTNGDIWIPICEVKRRREIRNRYMKSEQGEYILSLTSDGIYTEGMENLPSPTSRWRHHMIRFFKRLPPCKRRAQEVPYQLEGTGRWQGLKDALADLDCFRIKWTSGNRSRWELYRMWKTLSGVKLDDVALVKHASAANVNLSRSWSSTSANAGQAVVDDSDDEISRGQFSIRRGSGVNAVKLPKNTYDVVAEYNYSIGQWYVIEEPHSGKLVWTLEQLSQFFLGFGDFEDEMNLPEYLVPHLDEGELCNIGFEMWPEHLRGIVKRPSGAPKEKGLGRPPPANESKKKKKRSFSAKKLRRLDSGISTLGGSTPMLGETGLSPVSKLGSKTPTRDIETPSTREELDFKLYRRWVWIMFPWLALAGADSVVPARSKIEESLTPYKKKSFWEVKKIDPKGEPKIQTTPLQLKSQLNAERMLLENAVTSPAILRARDEQRRKGNRSSHEDAYKTAMKRVKGKQRPTREEALRDIPFSSPSTRTLKTGTRFPTVEKMEREDPERRMLLFSTGVVSKDHAENASSSLIKILPPSHEFDPGTVKHMAAHTQNYPATERDANIAGLNQMIHRLRDELDNLMYEKDEKIKALFKLEKQVGTRNFMDDYTQECIVAGEAMIDVLKKRIKTLNKALRDGDRLGKFYGKVMNVCGKHPARDEVHLQKIERRLKVSDSRSDYLVARQTAAKYEYNHLLNVEKPALIKESKKADEMMAEAVQRLKKIRKRMQREQEKEISREKRRELTRNTIVHDDMDNQSKLAAKNVLTMLTKNAIKTKLQETKVDEAEYESAFAKIKSATGISDPNMVFIKFINKDQVYASLEDQRRKYEEKIRAMDKKSYDLSHTLQSLQSANNFISSRHIREVDDQTFVSESKLHLEKVRWNNAQQLLKDVQSGTLHLATMLGIKNRSKPFVIKKDINKNKHDYVTLDPKLVGKEIDRRLSEIEHSLMSMLKTLPKDNALKDYVDDPNYTPKLRERKSRSGGSNSSQGGLRYEIRVPSRQSLLNAEEEGLQAALEEIAIYDEDEMKVHEKVRGELKSREKEAIKLKKKEVERLAKTQ
jgi:hypothetical protein